MYPFGMCTSMCSLGTENPCATSVERMTSRTGSPAVISIVATAFLKDYTGRDISAEYDA